MTNNFRVEDIVFAPVPPKSARRSKYSDLMNAIKSSPGKSGRIATGAHYNTVSYLRKRYPEFQITGRGTEAEPGRFDIWVEYLGS